MSLPWCIGFIDCLLILSHNSRRYNNRFSNNSNRGERLTEQNDFNLCKFFNFNSYNCCFERKMCEIV
uniref:Uncharacterized protein n=1 Tax=Medicago truncatula TaxID=3880 RepID=I3SQE5_MEDTR|nr:unknown [Medicago truncatula]